LIKIQEFIKKNGNRKLKKKRKEKLEKEGKIVRRMEKWKEREEEKQS